MNTLTYNQYSQTYTIKYQPQDYAFPEVLKFNHLSYANPLKAALTKVAEIRYYLKIKITINI